MKQRMALTAMQFRALHYIGRTQKFGAKVGRTLSPYLLEKLKEKGLALEYEGIVILTDQGRQEISKVLNTSSVASLKQS